jgi:hypothetical protein
MKTIFVSCQDTDDQHASSLIESLKATGFQIEHSPRNPLRGADERWNSWYDVLLPEIIQRADAFIIILDAAWDSSTWMAIESERARQRTPTLPMFAYNPQEVKVIARGMTAYVKEALPGNVRDAVDYLVERLK